MARDYRYQTSPTKQPRIVDKLIVGSSARTFKLPLDPTNRSSLDNNSTRFGYSQADTDRITLEDYPPPPPLANDPISPTSSSWSLPRGIESPITPKDKLQGATSTNSPASPLELVYHFDTTHPHVNINEDQEAVVLYRRTHESGFLDNMLDVYGPRATMGEPEPVHHSNHAPEVEKRGFKGLLRALREKEKERPREGERERNHYHNSFETERSQWEISRLVGLVTSTMVGNWDDVMIICERVNQYASEAKDTCKALRRDIKSGLPPTQLSAGRLWAILMRNCTKYFVSYTTNRKFLGVVEDVALSHTTAQVVRDRLVEVVGTSVYMLRDSRDLKLYQSTWKKLRLQLKLDHPSEGLVIPVEDPFWCPAPHTSPLSPQRPSYHEFAEANAMMDVTSVSQGLTKKKIEPVHREDGNGSQEGAVMERLLDECEIALHNSRILSDALLFATPGNVKSDPLIREFRERCMKSREILAAEIARTHDLARVEQLLPSGSDQVAYTTMEEQLFHALVTVNKEISGAFKVYDDLERLTIDKQEGVNISQPLTQAYAVPIPDLGDPFVFPDPSDTSNTLSLDLLGTAPNVPIVSQGRLSTSDWESTAPNTQPRIQSASTPLLARVNHRDVTIGRKMVVREVVSHLVEHGCRDLSSELDLSSFDEYPASHGGLSDIYQGQLLNGTRIAVKALRISADTMSQDPKHLKHAARELHTWRRCQHPNIVTLLGLAIFRGRIGMVAPWMEHGNLPRYLERVTGVNRFNMCIQICEGLSYLHQIGIIHCDLKGANVLISEEGSPVLTDFGTSLMLDRTLIFTQTTSGPSFTVRWSAAEIIEETTPHTEASDVYALGMTIYETMTGKVPYHGKSESNVIRLVTVKKVFPERPECMSNGNAGGEKLWELLTRCWSYDPTARPSATEVTNDMKEIDPTS